MTLTPAQIRIFRKKIFSWWHTHKRDLPWRYTRDPYRIVISEIMLQQTQVSRVLPKYKEFLTQYPDVFALARSPVSAVLRVWKGMGYNRRALYLKRMAQIIVDEYNGKFPETESLLTKLPGLGTYTARALMVFAFGKDVAMVDTNIRQIITRYFYNGLPQKEKTIQGVADTLVPKGKSWAWHQALMDFGALELNKSGSSSVGPVKQAKPFRDSDRFYRGRIVDILREGDLQESRLIRQLVIKYRKSGTFYTGIIDGLIRDGLALRSRGHLSLP